MIVPLSLKPGIWWYELAAYFALGSHMLSVTMKDALFLVSGLLTPVIAILAAGIAYQQWRVQHIKLRLRSIRSPY